ncbi:NAD-dependent epimerase/dehydratase family protein [Nocardia carnea]|uniref:NAD-dependent epimerase/dehydratase family protein n=1 Tax=Nocardia carnea TaxID=37328 RepID=UPI002456448E|nr:NAD-dependent epimerase/dehydratase family protein [Nocardia carnea]
MRVVVTGATGNVGIAVLDALAGEPAVTSIAGLARRRPDRERGGVEWVSADVRHSDLGALFRGADAVIHLAWSFQPTRQPIETWRTNVGGTERVLDAVATAGVPALIYASSIGAYSPATGDEPVDEAWPTEGWPGASYMVEKAYVERLLDLFEQRHGRCRVVRMRPAFLFQDASAAEQRRLFAGPFVPNRLIRPGLLPVLPYPRGLRFQTLHTADVGRAYAAAVVRDVRGAFNLAAEPLLDRAEVERTLGLRTVAIPQGAVRSALAAAWHLRLVPANPGLFDALMCLPVMSTERARAELDWTPQTAATDTLRQFLDAFRRGAGGPTPPLAAEAGGAARHREISSGVGRRDPVDE